MQSKYADKDESSLWFKEISILIPCRNEMRGTLVRAMAKLQHTLKDYTLDIMIIENGSDNLDGIPDARYHFIEQGGLGIALKIGLMKARHEKVFFLPADMSYDLSFIDMALYFDMADIVIASKFVHGSKVERPLSRRIGSRLYSLKNRYWEGLKVRDATGAKMFNRRTVLPLLADCDSIGIAFEIELIKAAMKNHLNIKEIPAIVHDYGKRGLFRWL
jgi:glycosyltransferase involved in cell wall biosynthesis